MARMQHRTRETLTLIDETALQVPPMVYSLLEEFRVITDTAMAAVFAERGTRGQQPDDYAFAPSGSRPPPEFRPPQPPAQRRRLDPARPQAPQPAPAAPPPPAAPSPHPAQSPAPPLPQSPLPEPFTPLESQFGVLGTSSYGVGEASTSHTGPAGVDAASPTHTGPDEDLTQPGSQDMGGVTQVDMADDQPPQTAHVYSRQRGRGRGRGRDQQPPVREERPRRNRRPPRRGCGT